jgi:hypothetical protein
MKIRLFCMIALLLSAAACTYDPSTGGMKQASQTVPSFDGKPAPAIETA